MSTSKATPVTREELRDALRWLVEEVEETCPSIALSAQVNAARALLARLDAEDK